MDPKALVRDGYDRISHNYRSDAGGGLTSDYDGWLAELTPHLPPGAPVLELGCGCGIPVARALAGPFDYLGVDISPVQIERARRLVPDGRFQCADMAALTFPDHHFAAIIAFYAIIHLPLVEQPALFDAMSRWLQPGGYLLATVGHTAWTGTDGDWLGAPMYWSHAGEATYLAWLAERRFRLHWTRFIPEGDGGHTLLLAQKEAGDG